MFNETEEVIISTDVHKLDIPFIHGFISTSYWGKGRTIEQVGKAIENCFCFGVYLNNVQIGFARVLTDQVTFAYLMDVFIIEEHRGKGYSKRLLEEIFSHTDFSEVAKWSLATKDAHGLYKQFEFGEIPEPKRYMERIVRPQWGS